MLTSISRIGCGRHRLIKTFALSRVVAEMQLFELVGALDARLACLPLPVSVDWSQSRRGLIRIVTGDVWLNSSSNRKLLLSCLSDTLYLVDQLLERLGLSVAVCTGQAGKAGSNPQLPSGDDHLLILDSQEELLTCFNLLRECVPQLIAISGRADVGTRGVEPLGSKRLSESGHHFGCPYIVDTAPDYLSQVVQHYRGHGSPRNLQQFDVTLDSCAPHALRVRCIDSQSFLTTSIAHAVLLQAIVIRSRRLAQAGQRVFPGDTKALEANRLAAIAFGIDGRFDRPFMDGPDSDATELARRPDKTTAAQACLDLFRQLAYEWRILGVEFDEIAEFLLGVSLRCRHEGGVCNENEWWKAHEREPNHQAASVLSEYALTQWNRQRYPHQCEEIRASWEDVIHKESGILPVAPDKEYILSCLRQEELSSPR
ncbi:MAG: hypothetical protein IT423_17730 [Pirellulaceae bacterium]|nr:hypothetical protein [Pirellulaceae bacterium]